MTPGLQIPGPSTVLAVFISHPDILFVSYLFSHCSAVYICVQSLLFSCFSNRVLYAILIVCLHSITLFPSSLHLFHFSNKILFVEYRLLSLSLRNFLHPRVISSLSWVRNIQMSNGSCVISLRWGQRSTSTLNNCKTVCLMWGTAVAQWLRCCATNREVALSTPAGVIGIFHWHKILPISLWPWGRLSL